MANFFNEMYVDGGAEVRPHYRAFEDWLAEQPSNMLARKRAEADLIFRRVGILSKRRWLLTDNIFF